MWSIPGRGSRPSSRRGCLCRSNVWEADAQQNRGTGIRAGFEQTVDGADGRGIGVESQPDVGSTFWVRLVRASDDVLRVGADAVPSLATGLSANLKRGARPRAPCCALKTTPTILQLIDSVLGMLGSTLRLISAIALGLG